MIRKLTKKFQIEKQVYNFQQSNGIAGICPDCGSVVNFNSYHQRYQCTHKDCCFEANIQKERVWGNNMRDENLKKLKNQGLNI